MKKLILSISIGLLASLSACEGCEPDLIRVAPQIAVDVCLDPPLEIDGVLKGGVRDCNVDFGEVDISTRVSKEIRISNPSPLALEIDGAAFDTASDPAFRLDVLPEGIAPGLTAGMAVSVRPLVEGEITGTLVLQSNAENLAQDEDVLINFRALGVDNGVPQMVIDPPRCDFGRVAQGGVASCLVEVRNEGTRDLILESADLTADSLQQPSNSNEEAPFGFFGRPPNEEDAIIPGGSLTLNMRFTPDVLGRFEQNLRVLSNDPTQPDVSIPLLGLGVDPPICDALVITVNGIPVDADALPSIEPLDDVRLSAEFSEPSTPDGSIASVEWSVFQQPAGSTAVLTNPSDLSTGFFFAGTTTGVDLAGTYRVRATVTDDLGTTSVNECEVAFEAIPTDTILTQLSWDSPGGDMDLHFIQKTGGEFCSNMDGIYTTTSCTNNTAYYANRNPNWDGSPGTEGDPSLDIDDLCGFGPENTNIDIAVPGEYLVAVDYFGAGCGQEGSVGNTIRIYLFGQLQAEFFKDLQNGDWWEVAIIYWNGVDGDPPCIEELDTDEIECPQ